MPFNSIVQCDMCPTVTTSLSRFHRVKISNEPPIEEGEDRPATFIADAMLCPACAEPLLTFQRKLVEKNGTEESRNGQTKRLNERILSALKQTQ